MKLIPIKPKEQDGYICLDCWVEHGEETQATVFLRSTKRIGANGYPCQHALCGNHAEMINPEVLDKEQQA